MSWRVVVRSDAQRDVAVAAQWYEAQQEGLGSEFREAVIKVLDELSDNPLLSCRQHPRKNIRWRYPQRFPYRLIYEVIDAEGLVVVAAVLHAARHDWHWKKRV